jgi:hypothetical protein
MSIFEIDRFWAVRSLVNFAAAVTGPGEGDSEILSCK